ncbi:4-hydroxy-tetrahydrodipicolinate reductase [Domibacillus antri]|uniref:4-hydroxy-tetrahydrodipicolinate reductase n=1 Tax=Domibacillus antri TaxID=1714264 RepID=A0A1Q8Q7A1_9BACI|nr:4-hydroxy-tetrahydrodipicolinate reductase [Domibacillus antri]OLN23224.1 4-hydroxy-tetrahydrodipicolinate reductase [Domibacillus antri]
MSSIRVIIAGPRGRMGTEAVKMVMETPAFELVAALDRKHGGDTLSDIGFAGSNAPIYTDVRDCFADHPADVLIDLTTPEFGYVHTKTALEHGIRPVVGTTGFTDAQLEELKELSESKELGCIIAPNFAIGAVLMMKFSQLAAKYFQDVEIIELHHDKKLDAPSGTAVKTAQMINDVREPKEQGHPDEKETMPGVRGANMNGMHIHSVRLPGLIAHQQVLFGAEGESLTLRHDSFNRTSFMSGVRVCVETVMKTKTLVYGLENILD